MNTIVATALLIVAFTTPDGNLGLEVTQLPKCPPQEEWKAFLDAMVENKEIVFYTSECLPLVPMRKSGL